jgi:hypothetical protein
MSNLTINVSFLGGTDIKEAVNEAQGLRAKIGANIEFNFNGVHVFICRDDQTPRKIAKSYLKAIHSKEKELVT